MFPAAASSPANPSFPFTHLKIHDVYLSFCDPDIICQRFATRLCSALVEAGIFTRLQRKFTDDGPSYQRIRESRICIPILSPKFIQSQSFLNEVCFMVNSRVKIFPLFYHVLPSDVRHPERIPSAQDFVQHRNSEIIGALENVPDICGWSQNQYSSDSNLIEDVVTVVVKFLESAKVHLDTPKCFGLDWRVEHVRRLLNVADHQKKIVKVGIHGMGGMGKTTLAKVVCKQVFCSQFEVHCFVLGVGERCQLENGLVKLQNRMLKDVSQVRVEVDHIDRGKYLLQECLRGKRVLLLLDDIQSVEQLEALGGYFTDFGAGSRLLITSQNQQILRVANVDEMYEVRSLPQEHAMELFKFHAFPNSSCTDPELLTLSINIVNACDGHPLALHLLGKTLVGEDDRDVWKDMADKLRDEPCMQKKLRASYDTLDPNEKEMFLDVACLFTGQDKDIAMIFWAELNRSVHASLRHLLQKSLVNLGSSNDLLMHRCLQDLGTTVANEISTDPHKRTRLFDEDDVHHMLRRHWEKAKKVRYLRYEPKERKTVKADMFMPLYNLRLLWLANVEIKGHFPQARYFDELRWLRLTRCSLTWLPPGLNLNKLVILEVTDSQITHLWDEKTEEYSNIWPEKLNVLILRECGSLETLPATIIYTQLQILDLHNCHSLKSLPNNLGSFHSLVSLNMKGCDTVSCLPEDFGMLSSLQELDLSWCKNLRNLPASFGNLTRLEKLEIHHNSNLRELPVTIGRLESLAYLDAGYCQLCENGLPAGLFELSSLRIIHFEHNRFRSLPGSFQNLSGLWELHLDGCSELSELRAVPPSLEMLYARDCMQLQSLCCLSGLKSLCRLDVSRSCHLRALPGLESLQGLTTLKLVGCKNISSATLGSCLAGLKSLESIFIAGPGVTSKQLLSFYETIKGISFESQCLMPRRAKSYNWLQAEPNGQNRDENNYFEYCAAESEISYCAGYIVCFLSLGQVFDCEGRNRLRYSIERNQNLRACEMIHPDIDCGREDVLEVRVVRVEGDFDFNWLGMGDKLKVSAGSDHEDWKACFKFLMYDPDPLDVIYPCVEKNPPHTITFGQS
ncbi:disease resistance protein RPV1 isoform X3 [Cryptomeria japonica]|uniref:disease resistance protein RPV1 isoform X3 n=1 Tax=Cryptomeria japonica TaxID=3369 RepID=UPI0027DA11E9|nr:disease resistance protein RPV1 isoform X3 [Cryptomeria japonica]